MSTTLQPHERTIVRGPTASRTMTRWSTDDLAIAEALTGGGHLERAAALCWSLLGDGRVRAALETRTKGLLKLPMDWEESGDRRSSGRVVKALRGGDWAAAHSEAALVSLAMWGILLGIGLNQRVWIRRDGRDLAVHRPYDVRHLRWDATRRVWVVRTMTGDVDILPGDRRWVLYAPSCSGTPDGDELPWMYGAWRACAKPWLGKDFSWGDWQHHGEMHGSPIRTAEIDPAHPPKKEIRDNLCETLGDLGGNASVIPPPGFLKLSLLEAKADTWKMFPGAIETASREIVVAVTGQTSSTDVRQGQDTGATLHGLVRQDLIDGDAATLSTCLHDQDVSDYAEVNFGDASLAPWPRWRTDPPANIAARGKAMTAFAQGVADADREAPAGTYVDRDALYEEAGIPLLQGTRPDRSTTPSPETTP